MLRKTFMKTILFIYSLSLFLSPSLSLYLLVNVSLSLPLLLCLSLNFPSLLSNYLTFFFSLYSITSFFSHSLLITLYHFHLFYCLSMQVCVSLCVSLCLSVLLSFNSFLSLSLCLLFQQPWKTLEKDYKTFLLPAPKCTNCLKQV
jgi:hypothetical protein